MVTKQKRHHGSALPTERRLGFRPLEFASMLGISKTTLWRLIKEGKIEVIEIGGIKLIPRVAAVKAGLISE